MKKTLQEYKEIVAKEKIGMSFSTCLELLSQETISELTDLANKMYYEQSEVVQAYAKLQIEKDRERVEENAIYIDGSADIEATHNNTPIILE